MKLVKRSEFGWGPSGASSAHPSKGLVIHYDGSKQGLADKPHSTCVTYWKNTRRFHVGSSRGWADIGYSFGACPHGYVFEGRGVNRIQAAQPTGNSTWYSVTLMSGPGETPTTAQIEAVRELRAWLMDRGVAGAVKGHRDFYSTDCPGSVLYAMVRDGTFAKKPSGATSMIEEDDVDVNAVWHDARIKMNKGEDSESERSPASFLQEIETEQDRIKTRLDNLDAKMDAMLNRLSSLGK
ncbi:peptidoglycan recognition family protein [Nonomuraea sp. B12E4]|uniref:peptidoglycan recognition protein family protein n=1 Tax=Nonomuraea sp. B12E4 TaxID=3153564 RepID=UPI00325D97CC